MLDFPSLSCARGRSLSIDANIRDVVMFFLFYRDVFVLRKQEDEAELVIEKRRNLPEIRPDCASVTTHFACESVQVAKKRSGKR